MFYFFKFFRWFCQFPQFWDEVRTERDNIPLLRQAQFFSERVRDHIGRVISITHQNVPLSVVVDCMRFPTDQEMDSFFQQNNWSRDDVVVVIPLNVENQPKQPKFKEKLSFQQLAPMLSRLNA